MRIRYLAKAVRDTQKLTYDDHAKLIAQGRSTFFHINQPFVANTANGEIGVPHIHTDKLHYCAAAIVCDKQTQFSVAAVHFSGNNMKEVEDTIKYLDHIKPYVQVFVGNNEAADLHPIRDASHFEQRINNFNYLMDHFKMSGFETERHQGKGRVFGFCSKEGVFQGG